MCHLFFCLFVTSVLFLSSFVQCSTAITVRLVVSVGWRILSIIVVNCSAVNQAVMRRFVRWNHFNHSINTVWVSIFCASRSNNCNSLRTTNEYRKTWLESTDLPEVHYAILAGNAQSTWGGWWRHIVIVHGDYISSYAGISRLDLGCSCGAVLHD